MIYEGYSEHILDKIKQRYIYINLQVDMTVNSQATTIQSNAQHFSTVRIFY